MCGRYFQGRDPAELADYLDAPGPPPNLAPSWNVAPTQDAPVVRRHPETGTRHLGALRWGLVPRWAGDVSVGARMINARAETVAEKPAFRDAYRRRRCLVVADGFYEWSQEAPSEGMKPPPKQAWAVARADGAPMVLAGLWEGWRGPGGEVVRSFAIVTTDAAAAIAHIHHRMPVILAPADWPRWLGEADPDGDPADLLRPCPPGTVRHWPVSSRVNRVRENDPSLLEPEPDRAEAAAPNPA